MDKDKEINTSCGIYLITNLINGKQYIGQSININHRWIAHKNPEDRDNRPMAKAMRKYGRDNFKFEIIDNCLPEELNEKEIFYIKKYNTIVPNGYNVTYGGQQEYFYDYEAIYHKWQEGYLCKELEEIFNCSSGVIHNALLIYGITQEDIYSKGSNNKKPIIAFDIKTKKPLKIFSSMREASKILFNDLSGISSISYALKEPFKNTGCGFYWDYKRNNSLEIKDIDNLLQYQNKFKHYSQNIKKKCL